MNARVANLLVKLLGRSGVTVYQWGNTLNRAARVKRLAERLASACGFCQCEKPWCRVPLQRHRLPAWAPSLGLVLDGVADGLGYVLDAATLRVCTVCGNARPAALCVGWTRTFETTGGAFAELASVCPNCALASNVGRASMGSA